MTSTKSRISLTLLFSLALPVTNPRSAFAQTEPIHNRLGIQMTIDPEDHDPAIAVTLPGNGPAADRTFHVLLPEHLTVRKQGDPEATHLYIFQPGTAPASPHWQQSGDTLQYTAHFGAIHLTASATLADDGVHFRYHLQNGSAIAYDMATAITDPRFHTVFYDPRLERTFVHYPDGFALLAAETPERLSMPLNQWLPVRYHAQYTAPVPAQRVQHSDDGVTRRYASRKVDVPLIATRSSDGKWVAASFSRNPGNVWSNPELTCQHVDETAGLPPQGRATLTVKLLLLQGSLAEVLRRTEAERASIFRPAGEAVGPRQPLQTNQGTAAQ